MTTLLIILNYMQSAYVCLLSLGLVILTLSGCARKADGDMPIDGLGTFQYSVVNGTASLSVVFEKLHVDAGARIPIQQLEGAFVELAPDFQSGGTIFKVAVPLMSLFHGSENLPVVGLPDGRPIPGVRDGALGAFAMNLPVIGPTYFYQGADAFGLFFALDLPNLPVMVSSNIRDEKGNIIGVIYGVPRGTKGTVSGVLFLFPLEG
jgi:hypothetical protein